MKLIKKVKSSIVGIIGFLLILPTRIFAAGVDIEQTLYGVKEPESSSKFEYIKVIWNILKILVIPLTLIIGLAAYYNRSKKSKKEKIIIMIGIIVITVLVCLLINAILNSHSTF